MDRFQRVNALRQSLAQRILVIDGAMGTAIQALDLGPQDFGGSELEGCNENLVLTRPDIISKIHRDYLEAGADIIETNTFGGTPLVLAEYGLEKHTRDINLTAARLARKACENMSGNKVRFVAGSMGPTTKAISVTGGITFDELIENFYQQALALYEGGVDYFLLETCQDTRNIKAALLGIDRVLSAVSENEKIPVAITVTIEPMGTMLAGQSIEALYTSVEHLNLLYIGLNCATGPEFMTDHIRSLSSMSRFPVACVPNAGLPDENGKYVETPQMIAATLRRFAEQGWLNLVGGCCGTTAPHIYELAQTVASREPRKPVTQRTSNLSGIDYLEITDEIRPVLVGERTNVIGSRKFKQLMEAEKYEEAAEVARAQVKQGAQIIDICCSTPDRDELRDVENLLPYIGKMVRVPIMIDSTDDKVIAKALTFCQGKSIINSINLEDGEERFKHVVPLAKQFGAALVVGTIDDDPQQGMGVTRARKLAIAERSYDLLVNQFGFPPEDIYWDPLVFPCATGDSQYIGSAPETIEALRLLKARFPKTKTVLGISNVSFGLPPQGREVLNSVFLYHCTQAGLDLAIVNSEKLIRYPTISPKERELSENLLFHCDDAKIAEFTEHFRQKKPTRIQDENTATLTLEERLAKYIIEGTKDGLIEDLDRALKQYAPLEIINGPLMTGMDEVGRLFNNNELIVAEVLQSAEAMKAAVAHLEPKMDKIASAQRGKVVLATVKGDVHDIGKNLVEIILSNNGFEVINLGIKVPPETLIAAVREHRPDILGLSGLLVKSAQQMVATAQDLRNSEIKVPILVGGAALSENFTLQKIGPAYGTGLVAYASDAMHGLDLAKQITTEESKADLEKQIREKQTKAQGQVQTSTPKAAVPKVRSGAVPVMTDVPRPPDFDRHTMTDVPADLIWRYMNPRMLFGRHLGMKGALVKLIEQGDFKALQETDDGRKAIEIYDVVEELKTEFKARGLKPKAVYRFFEAASQSNLLHIYLREEAEKLRRAPVEPKQSPKPLATFDFPRQQKVNGLCLSDYVNPLGFSKPDNICMFVVTAGHGIREWSEQLKKQGQYLKSHAVQALALETAEGFAEYLHGMIRSMWGFGDNPNMTMMERFQAKYRGKRYSFGYPACPVLDDQVQLFELLKPGDLGVELTEGFMMEPEASVSAIVFHHPAASYFGIGQ